MTHLCVPIFITDLTLARRDITAAVAAGADMVELRTDKLHDFSILEALLKDKLCEAIITSRSRAEGGFSPTGEEEARAARLTSPPLNQYAPFLDIEIAAVQRHPTLLQNASRETIILSTHDFAGKPANLSELSQLANSIPAAVTKIVWKAGAIRDNLDALNLLKNPPRPTIALCMGEPGLISRVLAKKFAAFLTFASLNAESATAPGQITIADMKNLYRWDAIRPSTKVFGVVAKPVGHSMSPALHNAAFTATGFDGIYLPMLVEPDYESFKNFLDDFAKFEGLDLTGLSVTIPHKGNALRYLKETGGQIEDLAGRIGAVNTLSINPTGKHSGKNTDYAAILDSIITELGITRDQLSTLRAAVVGAGGTGRAAVAALAHYGAETLISNRDADKARSLANEFNGHRGKVTAMPLDDLLREKCDVFINTTSVGMFPKVDETPLGDRRPPFSAKMLVFDTIYNPMKTKLLTQAEGCGSKTISGVEMFVRQAAVQFETWTGLPAPREVMRQVIADRLGKPLHSR